MNNSLDYINSLGMSNDTINKIIKYDSLSKDSVDLDDKLKNIYDILGFAGFSNEEIERIISSNVSILDFSMSELCKLAAVLENVDFKNDLIEKKSISRCIINYKRVFIRNLVMQKNIDEHTFGNSALVDTDYNVYGTKYKLSISCYKTFGVYCNSDDELEQVLDNKLVINGKHYSVDECIKLQSSIFYRRYLQYKNKLNKRGISR